MKLVRGILFSSILFGLLCQVANAAESDTLLSKAAEKGDLQAAKLQISKGANVNSSREDGLTPLILATKAGNIEMVRELLSKGADPNKTSASEKGGTVLNFAAASGDIPIMTELVKAGANVNNKSRNGYMPLYIAADQGKLDAIKFLLEKGAMLEATNSEGTTALMQAARIDNVSVVEFLVSKGANVNARGPHGHTALIYAAYHGWKANAKCLLEHGADPVFTAYDPDHPLGSQLKYDAMELARQGGHKEIMEMVFSAAEKRKAKVP